MSESAGLLGLALEGLALGLSIVPPRMDGSKRPLESWARYQRERPDAAQLRQWYAGAVTGIGCVCGAVSGNLELFEFDDRATFAAFLERAVAYGLGELVARIRAGYEETTPGDGVHWLYRCEVVRGNTKLARGADGDVLIETRGEGGYVVLAPSNGRVHPSGRAYELCSGGLSTLVTLTPEEREQIWQLARTFDAQPTRTSTPPQPREAASGRPGDDFNARAEWAEVLAPHGWQYLFTHAGEDYWCRPGKQGATSATTNYHGSDLLHVFTTSTDFEANRSYSKFSAYTILEHRGDFRAAARALRTAGYGEERQSRVRGGENTGEEASDDRPVLDISSEDTARLAGEIWHALQERNEPPQLFAYAGNLARVDPDEQASARLTVFGAADLAYEVARTVRLVRGGGELGPPHQVHVPQWLVTDLLAEPSPPLPPLIGVRELPSFGPAGELELTPGYHAGARTYYAPPPGIAVPSVSEAPSEQELAEVRKFLLEDLLGDFPFAEQSDRANAIGLFLLPFVRDLIAGPTPLHGIEAATPGTGKGLLVDVLLAPALGRNIGVLAPVRDEDEMRKRLTAGLLAGHSALVLDNVRSLDSAVLCAALTTETWQDRRLGASVTVRLPVRTLWVATGNNVSYSTEMARRTVRIRLRADRDQPWLRPAESFRHPDLRHWVMEGRDVFIWAGLTLVRAWFAAGRPSVKPTLGSFEDWAQVVGGVLAVAGIDGFLGNALEFYEQADIEGQAWRTFVTAWAEQFNTAVVGVAQLLPLALECEGIDLGRGEGRSQASKLGRQLQRQRDRIFAGWRISSAGTSKKLAQWQLLPTGGRDEHL